MASNIIMPKQGLQMTEGTIIKWLKKEGETVKEGEPLFEMETDKLTITIDSTATGTLLKIIHGENDVVPITETIAIVGEPGEKIDLPAAEAPAAPTAPTPTSQELAALNQKIAELLGAVQQHNILTISRETPPQSPGEIAEVYLTNLINGGRKNNA